MVKKTTRSTLFSRPAFTMIELIFAIVIIAISILGMPVLLQTTAESQEDSMFQEGIMLTSEAVSQALSFQWDPQSSLLGAGTMTASAVLNTGGDPELEVRVGDFRVGHFPEKLRRKTTPASAPRNASAIANGTPSISGQDNVVDNIGLVNAVDGFKKQWNVTTRVFYVNDAAAYNAGPAIVGFNFSTVPVAGGTTNIKMVQVTATDTTPGSAGDQIQITSYACNIGENEFYKERY